ncbi:MAG: serine/threonine-protein kinase PknK, partial [Verrucomicrobia bacterium]|nr:serine/threonine-protein kinase PknK [Verrucomicrobiota bacterium]
VVTPSSKHSAQTAVKRLEREYSLRPRLDPAWAIVPLALVREAGKTSLVLEDPGGQPLDAVLGRPLDLTEFLRIGIGLAKALGKLHERGIVHRDINPANIRVNLTAARVWLTSFGIASDPVLEHQATDRPESADGDLAYIAPEQTGRLNRPIDRQSDLYSLGVTLYKMLTGTLPFTASEPIDWVHCHIARQPAAPEKWRKEIPPALSAIVLKLLAKTPEERYQTAVGLEADLKRCLDELESLGRIKAFVLGTQDLSDRLSIPEKLYGRDRESEVLLGAFERVSASGNSEIVLVSGYSGIGKSSVVSGLQKTILSSRGIFASGKFDQYKPDVPYATIAQAFQTLIRQILGKDEAEVVFWRDAIRRAVDSNGQLMVNLVPELELMIGKQEPVPDLPAQDADNRFQRVFRAFLGVFARSEHPLALFVDDLQWLDTATLKLLENLVADPELRHLLLIGAYRDNEVGPSHPLTQMLDSMRKNGARAQEITLRPLCLDDVARLISASLHQERSAAEPLDLLIHGKTGGNPFFVIQFLTAMVGERLIEFDPRQPAWRWDIDRIRARGITDNVADLLIQKLYRLPAGTRDALKQLACLGSSATTATLTVLSKSSDAEVHSNLRPAIRDGCVVRQENSYTFIHDRIQEAAYSLIPAADRAAAHLHIGRLLLASTAADDLYEQIFEIVGQFNHGTHLIKSADERQRLAQLNLMAGQRARASGAHALALKYFSIGSELLARDSWTQQYELTFSLEFRRAESEFVTGDLEAADGRLAILSLHARGIVDNAAVTCLGLDLYTTIYRSDRAVEICLEYLKRLDISWSPHPTDQEVVDEYERMWRSLENRPIEDLIDLPAMNDPEWSATMDVLAKVMPPAMFTDKNLQCLVLGRMASLSLEHGNCDGSCLGYVWLGGILGSHFGNYQAGFRFGKLSIELMEKRGLNRFSARVYLGFACLVNFWTQHLRTGFALVRRAFDAAQEAGDLTYAAYARYDLIGQLLLSGDPLAEVQREAELAVQLAKKARFGPMVDGTTVQLQLIRMLRGLTPEFGSFNDEQFDEAQFEQRLEGDACLANSA